MRPRVSPLAFVFAFASAFAFALTACSTAPRPSDGGDVDAITMDAADVPEDVGPPPPRVCRAGTSWSAGAPAFQERTMDWGLAGLNGTNMAVGDIDGDGYADLILPHGSVYDRTTGQVFMNRPGTDGRFMNTCPVVR